jgi:hypothetical protein
MKTAIDFLESHKELLTLTVAAIAGAFALWRWMVDQKWRRVQYAQSLIKVFLEKKARPRRLRFSIPSAMLNSKFQIIPRKQRRSILRKSF